MNHKHIVLVGFFFSILGYGKNRSLRAKELREASYVKALELQKIAKQISEVYDVYVSFRSRYALEMALAVQRKINQAKDNGTFLTEEQAKQEIINALGSIESNITLALHKGAQFEYDLTKDFFFKDKDFMLGDNNFSSVFTFDILAFFFVRLQTESWLLTHLVTHYQALLRELLAINKKLFHLERKE